MTGSTSQGFPASSQQRHVWSLRRGERSPVAAAVLRLEGAPDRERLRRALASLVDRHEVLRTRFVTRPGMRYPLQVVEPLGEPPWQEAELPGDPGVETVTEEVGRSAEELVGGEGDGALFGVRLFAGPGQTHLLALAASALIADGRTLDNLGEELVALYDGDGAAATLGEPVQYADFAAWQDELLEDGEPEAERGRRFWSAAGSDGKGAEPAGAELLLPAELDPAGSGRAPSQGTVASRLDPAARGLLAEAAGRLGAAPEDLVLAAFGAWLARLTGAHRVPLAVIADGRPFDELAGAFGVFATPVPIEIDVPPHLAFDAFVDRIRRTVWEAVEHAHYFDWEARETGLPDIGFAAGRRPPARTARGIGFRQVWRHAPVLGLKLRLEVFESEEALDLELTFDRGRIVAQDAARFLEQIVSVVRSAADGPAAALGALPILGPRERAELLGLRKETGAAPAGALRLVHERIEARAAEIPGAPAVVSGEAGVSYGELDARASRLAGRLRQRGLQPGQPVAVVLERSVEAVIAMVAVLKAGGAFACLELEQPPERRASMLRELNAPLAIVHSAGAAGSQELLAGHRGAVVDLLDGETAAGTEPTAPVPVPVPAESLAYVVFTSGSTGRPKGVGVEHRHLATYLDGVVSRLDLAADRSFACVTTFAADLGFTMIFSALSTGGTLHVVSAAAAADAEVLGDRLRSAGIECMKLVPSHLRALLASADEAAALPVRQVVLGGETLDRDLVADIRGRAPECRIDNHYGPTETTVGVLTQRVDERIDERAATVPVGRPLPGARAHVVGPDLELVPFWLSGELVVGGATVTRGYLGRPGLTAERFVPDPFGPETGSRLYRTGDLVRRLGDGSIEFLGRADRQVKYHGFRVELDEIGRALGHHAEIGEAYVRLCRDDDGRDVLVAYYAAPRELPRGEAPVHGRRARARRDPPRRLLPARRVAARSQRQARHRRPAAAGPDPPGGRRLGPPRSDSDRGTGGRRLGRSARA